MKKEVSKINTRGVMGETEFDPNSLIQDTRPMMTKFGDWLKSPGNMFIFLFCFCAGCIMFPGAADNIALLAVPFYIFAMRRKEVAPLKIPIQEGLLDVNEPHPATGAPMKGAGIFYIGNEKHTGKEIWITNSDCRQHFLILGTTGAGKALPKRARIHTPSGFVSLSAIRIGDEVTLQNGSTARITGVYDQGELQMFKVIFEDGRTTDACTNHQWKVIKDGKASVINTDTIRRELHRGHKLAIPLPEPVEKAFDESLRDKEVLDGRTYYANDTRPTGFVDINKYQNAAVEQRFAFLRGFLSGTSSLDEDKISIKIRNVVTADNIRNLVWSLGGICHKKYEFGFYVLEILHQTPAKLLYGNYPSYFLKPRQLKLRISKVFLDKKEDSVCVSIDSDDPLFITDDYIVTHNTEALISFAANAMSWGSGFLFCDGKGDVSLFAKVLAMARRFGREDDFLVLNFMIDDNMQGVPSNTLNPYASGAADNLVQMTVSLMDDAGGDGAMWKGRAAAMLTGVLRALVYLRDNGLLDLNVGVIRDHMQLRAIIDLASEQKTPDMPAKIRKSLKSYLSSLPGYKEEKKYDQAQTTLDQHRYLEMQFTKILGNLADVYGHVFDTPYAEIDMYDVVINRRILVIMLPALQKASDEIANLGKIVASTLKNMMGQTLGSNIEGDWDMIVENRPTTSKSPYLVILDEVGYYTVDGMALMAAQARSLRFSMIYASQDIPAMKKLQEKEAASIIANTNIKVFMRTEEMEVTGKLAVETGGKAVVAKLGGYEYNNEGFISGFNNSKNVTLEEKDRIHSTDIKQQGEGELTVMMKERIIRGKSFYAEPQSTLDKGKLKLRANHFIEVRRPKREDLIALQKAPEMISKFINPAFKNLMKEQVRQTLDALPDLVENKDEIGLLADYLEKAKIKKKGVMKILDYCAVIQVIIDETRGAIDMASVDLKSNRFGVNNFSEDFDFTGRADAWGQHPHSGDPRMEDGYNGMAKNLGINPNKKKHRPGFNGNVDHAVHVESKRHGAGNLQSNHSLLSSISELDVPSGTTREELDGNLNRSIRKGIQEPMPLDLDEWTDNAKEVSTKTDILEDIEEEGEGGQNSEELYDYLQSLLNQEGKGKE